jgi:hypothetical protein
VTDAGRWWPIPTFDVWAAASDEVGKSTLLGTWAGGPVGQRGSTFGVSVLHRMMGGGDVLVQTFGPDFYAGGTDRILTRETVCRYSHRAFSRQPAGLVTTATAKAPSSTFPSPSTADR